jgi:hypothetical protein
MEQNKSVVERAFELARSGKYSSVKSLVAQLNAESYNTLQITGRTLRTQLRKLIEASH